MQNEGSWGFKEQRYREIISVIGDLSSGHVGK